MRKSEQDSIKLSVQHSSRFSAQSSSCSTASDSTSNSARPEILPFDTSEIRLTSANLAWARKSQGALIAQSEPAIWNQHSKSDASWDELYEALTNPA